MFTLSCLSGTQVEVQRALDSLVWFERGRAVSTETVCRAEAPPL